MGRLEVLDLLNKFNNYMNDLISEEYDDVLEINNCKDSFQIYFFV